MPSLRHRMLARLVRLRSRFRGSDLERVRLFMRLATALLPMPGGVGRRRELLAGVPVEWLTPRDSGPGTLLYLHGGGYCLGSIETHRALAARLARAIGCRAVLPQYSLAPEHPFPAALGEVRRVYRDLLERGMAAGRLLVGGDSAGGGLALALLLELRTSSELPAGGVLLSPWTDLTLEVAARNAATIDDPMITLDGARRLAAYYVDDGDPADPAISPVFADLAGLPPLLVQVGTRELLLDDARRVVEQGRQGGVEVDLQQWSGMMHVFQAFAPYVPEARLAIEAIGVWARRRIPGGVRSGGDRTR